MFNLDWSERYIINIFRKSKYHSIEISSMLKAYNLFETLKLPTNDTIQLVDRFKGLIKEWNNHV